MNNDEAFFKNVLVISENIEKAKDIVAEELKRENVKIFLREDFLLEDAKSVIKEAYVAESRPKYILISAKSYNIYAQNSLLKVLEEPPRNIIFILISSSKTVFLPTIRSRISLRVIKSKKEKYDLGFDLSRIGPNEIFDFLKAKQRAPKSELKEIIQTILCQALNKYNMRLSSDEMEVFETSLQLAELNTRPQVLLTNVLLTIYGRSEKEKKI